MSRDLERKDILVVAVAALVDGLLVLSLSVLVVAIAALVDRLVLAVVLVVAGPSVGDGGGGERRGGKSHCM